MLVKSINKIKEVFKSKGFKKVLKNQRLMILVGGGVLISSLTVYSAVGTHNATQLEKRIALQAEPMQIVVDLPTDVEPKTEVVTEQVEVDVPFTETRRANKNMTAGEERIAQKGVKGTRLETYEITYVDGVMQEKVLVNNETIKKPVAQIVEEGGASSTLASDVTLASRGDDIGRYSKVLTMTATGYDACAKCGSAGGVTATGVYAKKGVVAVDPKVIPLGSRVYVESPDGSYVYGTAIAGDTGGVIKGNKIDLCFNSHQEAMNFGRRTVKVYILE